MKANQQHVFAMWGYMLTIFLLIALTLSLFVPHMPIPISMAQEPTRPAPGPDRPEPGPARDTPQPPATPPGPEPTGEPESPGEGTPEATVVAVAPVMPTSGGMIGAGVPLLFVGLAFVAAGVGVSVVQRRMTNDR